MKLSKKQINFVDVLYELGFVNALTYIELNSTKYQMVNAHTMDVLRNARRNFIGDLTEEEQYYYLNIHKKSYRWAKKAYTMNIMPIKGHTIFEAVECKNMGNVLFFDKYHLDIKSTHQVAFSIHSVRDRLRNKLWVETN